jgi:hypothetical protein
MTARHAGYLITLDEDVREDDAEEGVLNAIRMIKGVTAVEPVEASIDQQLSRARRDRDWYFALSDLIQHGPPERASG